MPVLWPLCCSWAKTQDALWSLCLPWTKAAYARCPLCRPWDKAAALRGCTLQCFKIEAEIEIKVEAAGLLAYKATFKSFAA